MTSSWPAWCVRQAGPGGYLACVWVHAPDAATAVRIADERVGPMGDWRTGEAARTEAFPRSEYAERATPRDFTCAVLSAQRKPD